MNFELTKEQQMIRDMVREFAQAEIAPYARELDEKHEFRKESFDKMAELGLFGIPFPEQYGGSGGDTISYALAVEEIGRACGGTGLSYAAAVSLGATPFYNFGKKTDKLCPKVSLDTKAYYATEYVGFNTRLNAFTYYGMNNPEKDNIGSSLRGIRDDEDKYNNGQIETSSAIVFNFDIPVKVVQTDWRAWGKKLLKKDMPSWFRYFDFELQISPFFDLALIRNTITGNLFNPKDGFYSAGLEIIVFPTKMRSIQVRVSAGTDISSYIADAEWRTKTSPEIQIGVGLHY